MSHSPFERGGHLENKGLLLFQRQRITDRARSERMKDPHKHVVSQTTKEPGTMKRIKTGCRLFRSRKNVDRAFECLVFYLIRHLGALLIMHAQGEGKTEEKVEDRTVE